MTAGLLSTLKSINPATLEVLAEVQVTPISMIEEIVEASKQTFETWRAVPLHERLRKVGRFRQLLLDQQDEIARLITREVGKPLLESYLGDLSGPLDTCVWLQKKAENLLASQEIAVANPLMLGKKHYLQYEPLGVIGIISPWNYPFAIPVMTILMALAAGNTVVLKPSEKSVLTGLKIGELFQQAGFPENAVSIVTGDGRAGEKLASLNLARLLFTGSVATGVKVINTAAPNITPLTLELGGKDAAIVLPDAPVNRTAQGLIWGAFTNAGQACASIERLYIVRGKNSEALLDKLVELTKRVKVGDPALPTTAMGPIIDVKQFDHVVNQVEQAVGAGAKILCGGRKPTELELNASENKLSGYFYQPTIITEVNHSMKIMQEETFGPVLSVMIVDSVEEAIALANQSMYGLSTSIWSSNIEKAKVVADKVETGIVFINDSLYLHALPELPWGGRKKSGFGRSHSQFSLLDLVNAKQISIETTPWLHRLWWYPYGPTKLMAATSGLFFLHDQKHVRKLFRLWEFISSATKPKNSTPS